jgi:inorganic pyrophosphatase
VLTCYVEMVPTDTIKYELDKDTGLLRMDRPQRFSNVPPSLYGLVPRTLCGTKVAARCAERNGKTGIIGDGDPMDVCILTEKQFSHGNLLVTAVPVGGLRMVDKNEADDKLICVLRGDAVYGELSDISQLSGPQIDRLRHYFLTYKQAPDATSATVEIAEVYGRDEALEVVRASLDDYRAVYDL